MKNQKLSTIYEAEQATETAQLNLAYKKTLKDTAAQWVKKAAEYLESGETYNAEHALRQASSEVESMQAARIKARLAATQSLNFYYDAAYKAEENQNLNVLAYCEAMAQDVEALLEQINA